MTAKHTKGEWKVKNLLHIMSDNKLIAHVDPSRGNVSDENCANAKLIAAAPDLLKACKLLVERAGIAWDSIEGKDFEVGCLLGIAKEAINKATL